MITLADMKGLNETEVKAHLVAGYSGEYSGFDYGSPSAEDELEMSNRLKGWVCLIAYESVGDYGCDSSSWFLLKSKGTGQLGLIEGSHCSCFGFEGQGDIHEVDLAYLRSDRFTFYGGGYDDRREEHEEIIKKFIRTLGEDK